MARSNMPTDQLLKCNTDMQHTQVLLTGCNEYVHVCVPGLYDRLTGPCSDMNYRHDCRQQQPTSGCQVVLETLGDRQQKAEKQEGGLIFHLPLIVPKKSHKLLAN